MRNKWSPSRGHGVTGGTFHMLLWSSDHIQGEEHTVTLHKQGEHWCPGSPEETRRPQFPFPGQAGEGKDAD